MARHTGPGDAADEEDGGLRPGEAEALHPDARELGGVEADRDDPLAPDPVEGGAEAEAARGVPDLSGDDASALEPEPRPWDVSASVVPLADEPPDLRSHDPSPEDLPPLLRPGSEDASEAAPDVAPEVYPRAALADAPVRMAEPAPSPVPQRPAPERRRSRVGALLLGGVVAASLGFGAAWVARDRLAPGLDPTLEARVAALEEGAGSQPVDPSEALAALEARVAALEAAPSAAPEALATLRDDVAAAAQSAASRADDLDARVAALEAAPVPQAPAQEQTPVDVAALRDGVQADVLAAVEPRLASLEQAQAGLGERVEAAEGAVGAARAEAEQAAQDLAAAEAEAAEAVRRAEAEGALAALGAALDAGEPLAPALDALPDGQPVPEALTAVAEGAPTVAALREAFPEAARAALAAAREAGLTEDGGGIGGFLRGQLSLRSTAPRAGDDPDAVLSRIQGALDQGRLAPALAEVDALPEPARVALEGWTAQARARADADAALATLRGAPGPATTTD